MLLRPTGTSPRTRGSLGSARPGRFVLGSATALTLVLTAGCSSGGDGGASAGEDSSGLVTEAQALIDEYKAQPEFQAPGPAYDASQLQGRTVALVAIDLRVPALAEVVEGVQEAAEQVGMNVTVFDAQSNPSLMNQGLDQAMNSKVDAIVSVGLIIDLISDQIATAKEAGIPMVDVINTPPESGVPGQGSDPNMFGNVAPDYYLFGRLQAAAAIVHTDGKAHVGIMNTSELTAASTIVAGMTDTFDECGSCDYVETDTALNDWSTKLPNQAASLIRGNPELNFLAPIYDNMAVFASAGVRQAGAASRVGMASNDGTAAALALIEDGDTMVADIAHNNVWAAWAALDQAMRGMLEMEPADPVLPIRYVDAEVLESENADTSSQPSVNEALLGEDYRAGFLELWGLS